MTKKKGLGDCDAGPLKAKSKNVHALNSATAFQSQTLEFQTAHVALRFGLSASVAAVVALHAFKTEARR